MRNESVYNQMTKSEKEVADLLKEMGIRWRYEQPIFVWDENKRPRVWAPDFYLMNLGVYVEVCGSENFNYDYRRRIFYRNGYQVIFLHLFEKSDKWKDHLLVYLQLFINIRNNKLNKLLRKRN